MFVFYKMTEISETDKSSTQKFSFILNIEALAKISHLQKKLTKEI